MGKVFPQAAVRNEMVIGGGSNRITIRKMFDEEKKELTDDKFSLVYILQFGYDKYPI
jgi:hypothetical protein